MQRHLNRYLRVIQEQPGDCETLEDALAKLVKWLASQPKLSVPLMFHLTLAQYMFAKALGAYIEGTTNASLHAELAEDLKWVLVATIDRVLEIYSQGIIRPGFVTMQVEWADDTPGV